MIVTESIPPVVDDTARIEAWSTMRRSGASLREIAETGGVSRERVRQVLTAAGEFVPRETVTAARKQALAVDISEHLKTNGPATGTALCALFPVTQSKLNEMISEGLVPRAMVLAGEGRHGSGLTLGTAAAAVAKVWKSAQREAIDAGAPSLGALSVGLYDRYRGSKDPSPASITARFKWADVCAAADVPHGAGRESYARKWSTVDLVGWIAQYMEACDADGERVTFDGYDRWRRDRDGAPSGALLRTRLRAAGYPAWADMVAATRD